MADAQAYHRFQSLPSFGKTVCITPEELARLEASLRVRYTEEEIAGRVACEAIEHRNQLAEAAAKLARAAQQTGDASLELPGMIPRPIWLRL